MFRLVDREPPFPTSVLVGHRRYRIQVISRELGDARGVWGSHDTGQLLIEVQRTFVAQTACTLLHEIMHAVFRLTGFDHVDSPSEEWLITGSSHHLTQVMQANPELRSWLAWAWAQEA